MGLSELLARRSLYLKRDTNRHPDRSSTMTRQRLHHTARIATFAITLQIFGAVVLHQAIQFA